MEPKFISFKVNGYNATAIYDYNATIKKLIYQYKGCYDYVLNGAFMNMYARELKIRYSDRVVIPVPSFKEDDELRGFNHVKEIFNNLGLKMLEILEKTEKHKQATSTLNERREVYKVLELNSYPDLAKKKVLIVDDVYTTGSTIKSAINLVEKLNPRKIDVFVIAKTKPKHQVK